ncbi:MAG: SDR family oxidoreductase [Alphaproteobacteria bacterium]|nr:SDR family oxidoreductase [Alphaproteobacteria bacterium]
MSAICEKMRLTGRCVLVTGASSGLGRHAAHLFAEAGARVALVARRRAELDALAREIAADGGEALAVAVDVTDAAAVSAAVDRIERDLAPIDVLLNNAGIVERGPALTFAAEAWNKVIDVDLTGAWHAAQAVAQRMAARSDSLPAGGGSIVNVTSYGAIRTAPLVPAYVAAKAALSHLTRALANELAPNRIRVNAIAPGLFPTEMTEGFLGSERASGFIERIPMRRPARLEELDGALLLLASDAGSYITGAEIVVDGGLTAS